MKKTLLTLIAAFALAISAAAQPTYTFSDFGVVGDSLFYTSVTLATGQIVNTVAGASQTWNYSTLSPTTQYNYDYLNPRTAGYRLAFIGDCEAGGGTLAGCSAYFNSHTNIAFTDPATFRLSGFLFDNEVYNDEATTGSLVTNIFGVTAHVNSVAVPIGIEYTNPYVNWEFPVTYGERDTSITSYTIDLNPEGVNLVYHAHLYRINHVDAWGSLTTPYTNYPSTVRHRATVLHTDTLYYQGTVLPITPTTDVIYDWFATAFVGPVFTMTGTVVGGNEYFTQATYLDTVQCLQPTAGERSNPVLPTIYPSGGGRDTVNFTNLSTNANSYTWNFGNPSSGSQNTSTSVNPNHVYDSAGTYTVELIACNTVCSPALCDTGYFTINVIDSAEVHAAFVAIPSVTCAGNVVRFKNNSTNATSYTWNFGDNTTSNLDSPTHIYTTAGTYVVALTAINGSNTDTARRTVTIQALPVAAITPNGPATFCNGDSVILQATGGDTYRWSTGQVQNRITVRGSGTYTVTAYNACGSAVSTPITTTVNITRDTITAQGPTTFCSGDSVVLQANTGTGLTYRWTRNGLVIVGSTSSQYVATTSGTYRADVTQGVCTATSDSIPVTVIAHLAASIFTQGSTTICAGDTAVLLINAVAGATYQWQLNGINISGATALTYHATSAGTYTAVVTKNGCSSTSNALAVTVNPLPTPTITGSSHSVCQGDSIFLTTQAGFSYQWLRNGANITGATSSSYNAGTTGNYRVITTALGCPGTSPAFALSMNPRPTADAGPTLSLTACNALANPIGGSPTASGGTPGYTYSWSPSSGLDSTDVSNPTVSHLGSTTLYTVVVTDANGCSSSDTVSVIVTGTNLHVSISDVGSHSWCAGSGDSLIMTAIPGGGTGLLTYAWTPSSGLTDTTVAGTVAKPQVAGTYIYSILVSDAIGCQAGASDTVTVNPQPVSVMTALDTIAPCAGDSVTFAATPGAGYSYQYLLNTAPISGATNVNYTTGTAGAYSLLVTEGSCSATSTAQTVSIRPNPTATITPSSSTTFCSGQYVILNAGAGAGYTYQWYQDGVFIIGGPTFVAYDSATYYVVATLNGCSSQSAPAYAVVYPYPADTITVSGVTTFCAGGSVQLNVSYDSTYTYIWQNNGSTVSSANGDSLIVTTSGTYNAVVTANGCAATSLAVPVVVNAYPDSIITAGGATTFCGGDSVVLSAQFDSAYSYEWQNDGVDYGSVVFSSVTALDSGLYTCILSSNGCTVTSNPIYVTVVQLPSAFATIVGADTVCAGDSLIMVVNAPAATSYQWQLAGNAISGATSSSYVTTVPGAYTVLITSSICQAISNTLNPADYPADTPVINRSGPTLTTVSGTSYQWYLDSVAISGATSQSYSPTQNGNYSVLVTNANGCNNMSAVYNFMPNGISNIQDFTTVSVYPNPAHDAVYISVSTSQESPISIRLYDIIGDEVATIFDGAQGAGNYTHLMPVAGFAAGIYLVKVSDGTSTITKRITIQ